MADPYQIRPADQTDFAAIKNLVLTARLNPTQLKWENFIVAAGSNGQILGCAQIKPHRDGSRELASLVVDPDHRGQGIARSLVEHLIGIFEGDLYLMCRASLGGFYEKFGFEGVSEPEMPPYFKRIARLASIAEILSKDGESLLIMKR